jgi:ferric hydroxamate transport system substrate-binding protein
MPTRRALLAAAAGLALRPAAAAEPMRLACLEWTTAEMLLSLGVAPLAVCDPKGYRDWVLAPALPADTIDLGSRGEPNRELLQELQPELILAVFDSGFERSDFAPFAPLFDVPFHSAAPYEGAQAGTLRLGERIGRAAEAAALVARTEAEIAAARARLRHDPAVPVCPFSFFDDRHLRIYGGGLLQDVLARLGLRNAWAGPVNDWGIATVGLEQLATIGEARLVCLEPIPPHARRLMKESTLWAHLPAVRRGPMAVIPTVWPFGGLAAASRFAGLLADRLA